MQPRTIYLDGPAQRGPKAKVEEIISIYASELATCERLIGMGFTHSGPVALADRARYLAGKIDSLK